MQTAACVRRFSRKAYGTEYPQNNMHPLGFDRASYACVPRQVAIPPLAMIRGAPHCKYSTCILHCDVTELADPHVPGVPQADEDHGRLAVEGGDADARGA